MSPSVTWPVMSVKQSVRAKPSKFMRRVAIPVTSAGRCLTPRTTASDTRRYTLGVISHVLTVTRHSSI